jgi:hypothetical protein
MLKGSFHKPFVLFLFGSNLLLFLLLYPEGSRLFVDTANYYSAAWNFAEGRGLVLFDGAGLTNTPPLFPLLLSGIYFFSIPIDIALWFVQFFFFNLFLFFLYRLGQQLKVEQSLYLFFIAFFGFAPVHVWQNALSEAPFLAVLVLWLFLMVRGGRKTLVYSAGAFSALCLLRYQAWFLVPGLFLPLFSGRLKQKYLILMLIPALFLTLFWWLYLAWSGYSFSGDHQLTQKLSFIAIIQNLQQLLQSMLSGQFGLNVALVVLSVMTIALWVFRYQIRVEYGAIAFDLCLGLSSSTLLMVLAQPGLSLVQLPRYLSILWPLYAIMLYLILIERSLETKTLRLIILSLFLANLGASYYLNKKEKEKVNILKMSHLKNLNLEKDLREFESKKYLSNFPDLVWWNLKQPCAYTQFANESDLAFKKRLGGSEPHLLIWFHSSERKAVMKGFPGLSKGQKIKPCFFGQGFTIYEILE